MELKRNLAAMAVVCAVLAGFAGESRGQLLSGPGAPTARTSGPLSLEQRVAQAERLIKLGRWEQAIPAIEALIEKAPAMTAASLSLSTCYIKLERFDDAFRLLAPILIEHPEHPFVLNNIAWVRLQSKTASIRNPTISVELSRRAVLGAPRRANIWGTLAEGYLATGNPKDALNAAEVGRWAAMQDAESDVLEFEDLVARCERELGKASSGGSTDSSSTE